MQTVGEFDKDDPYVIGHGHEHLSDVRCLNVVLGIVYDVVELQIELCNAVDKVCDSLSELLGNHAEIYGPIASALCFPVPVRFWVISKMMFKKKDVRAYLYENTFSKKTYLPIFVRKLLAWYLGWLSVNVMNSLRAIAVYRDSPMKLRQTLRESVEALENGENLMIFPEHPEGKYEKGGVSEFSPGFLMLAEAWWKKSGKKLRIIPVYANREERTFTFGDEITYEPENGFASESERVLKEARDQMLQMAGFK